MTIFKQDEIEPIDPNTIKFTLEDIIYLDSIRHRIPRLGRRDSMPHTNHIEYIRSVLKKNFPNDTTISDLWHYFQVEMQEEKFIPDIAFYETFKLDRDLKSYKSIEHGNKIPLLIINMMSQSTWKNDVSEIVKKCLKVKIPFYIVYTMYSIKVDEYEPPFLRIYEYKEEKNDYEIIEIRRYAKYEESEMIEEKNLYYNEKLPFRVGLEKILNIIEGERESRILIVDKKELKKLLSEKECVEYEKKKIEDEKKKIEDENIVLRKLIEKYKQKSGNL